MTIYVVDTRMDPDYDPPSASMNPNTTTSSREPVSLYRIIQVDKETGNSKVIYGHVTSNVVDQYWEAYVDEKHYVTIEKVVRVGRR